MSCNEVNVCFLGVQVLTSLAVLSSDKSWEDPLSGCKIAPYNSIESNLYKALREHSDQLWTSSVGNYEVTGLFGCQLCEHGNVH